MVKAKKYVCKNRFTDNKPKREDYEIVEYELPELKNGEIFVKNEVISVDPYQLGFNHILPPPYDELTATVGTIVDSRNPIYEVGTKVVSRKGWCDYYIANPNDLTQTLRDRIYKLPNFHGLPDSLAVGVLGMPGATAYFGVLDVCKPKPGETVVVTGAAGAVGSIAGQIARIKGCRVIGFAGSDEKVEWLEKELGFHKAYNYKTVDLSTALKEGAPNGIDCYFDNVGGEMSTTIMNHMNLKGRVAVCGSMSTHNNDKTKATAVQVSMVKYQLKMEGFVGWAYFDQWNTGIADMVKWIKSGELKAPEHVTEGFDKLVDAFAGMLRGENFGKAVVKV